MKYMKWKILVITCIVCLLPILLGIGLWHELPESIAIHFNIHNEPDNFASKEFTVFGLPVLMVILQIICCIINDVNAHKRGERKKFETVTKWIIPLLCLVLQIATFSYALGYNVDIRRVAILIVGCEFLVIGNYLPKFDYIKNYNVDSEKARKINRFIGFETVIMGVLAIVSAILPPIASLVWIFLLIPYAALSVVYGIIKGRK